MALLALMARCWHVGCPVVLSPIVGRFAGILVAFLGLLCGDQAAAGRE